MSPVIREIVNADNGVLPPVRRCEDALDLACWFLCVATALRVCRERTFVHVSCDFETPLDTAARKGRMTPNVRR